MVNNAVEVLFALGLQGKKSCKDKVRGRVQQHFALIRSPRIDKDEIEGLKGITAVFLATEFFFFFSCSNVPVSSLLPFCQNIYLLKSNFKDILPANIM